MSAAKDTKKRNECWTKERTSRSATANNAPKKKSVVEGLAQNKGAKESKRKVGEARQRGCEGERHAEDIPFFGVEGARRWCPRCHRHTHIHTPPSRPVAPPLLTARSPVSQASGFTAARPFPHVPAGVSSLKSRVAPTQGRVSLMATNCERRQTFRLKGRALPLARGLAGGSRCRPRFLPWTTGGCG